MRTMMLAAVMVSVATTVGAQVVVHEQHATAEYEQQLQVLLDKGPSVVHMSVESAPVTGAPYSGEAVTESIQTLADGNRIVKRTTVRVYRDSAGRTRRETLGPDGQVMSITITNPSTHESYVLDPATQTGRKIQVLTSHVSSGGAVMAGGGSGTAVYLSTEAKVHDAAKARAETKAVVEHQARGRITAELATAGTLTWAGEHATTSREELGQQTVEGVPATGTRSTDVIAAGSIGNELPITIVREEWRSPDLKVLVMTTHTDPRTGETTYRLTNISRGEPDASLFEVPAAYTVK